MNRIFLTATFLTSVAYAGGEVCPPNQQQQAPVQQAPCPDQNAPAQQAPVQNAPVQQQQPNCPNQQQQAPNCPTNNSQQQIPVEQAPVQQAPVQQAPVEQNPAQQAPVQNAPAQQAPVNQNQQQAPNCPPNQNQQQQAPGCTSTGFDQLMGQYAAATQYTHPESLMGRFGGRCFNAQTPNVARPFLFEARGFYPQQLTMGYPMGGMGAQVLAARFVYDELSNNVPDYNTFMRQVTWSGMNGDFGEPVQYSYTGNSADTGAVTFRVPAYGYTREIQVKRVGNEIMVRFDANICSAQAL